MLKIIAFEKLVYVKIRTKEEYIIKSVVIDSKARSVP